MVWLPFNNILKIWKECYRENPSQRSKLNRLDDIVSKRATKINAKYGLMVQFTPVEMNFIKNLYELI